jgi:hypothetical protein
VAARIVVMIGVLAVVVDRLVDRVSGSVADRVSGSRAADHECGPGRENGQSCTGATPHGIPLRIG